MLGGGKRVSGHFCFGGLLGRIGCGSRANTVRVAGFAVEGCFTKNCSGLGVGGASSKVFSMEVSGIARPCGSNGRSKLRSITSLRARSCSGVDHRVVCCNTPKAKGSRGVGRVLKRCRKYPTSGGIPGTGVFEAAFRPSDSCSAFIKTCGPAVRGPVSGVCTGKRLVDGLARVGRKNIACSPRGFKTGC